VHLLHGSLVAGKGRKAGGIFAWWLLLDFALFVIVLLASDFFWCDGGVKCQCERSWDRLGRASMVPGLKHDSPFHSMFAFASHITHVVSHAVL
jgi:hypothetical protein